MMSENKIFLDPGSCLSQIIFFLTGASLPPSFGVEASDALTRTGPAIGE